MAIEGWYYLHENGELIYKRDHDGIVADLRESDFVKALWPMDPNNRLTAWTVLIEGLAFGANRPRIDELVAKWGCDDEDAKTCAEHIGVRLYKDGVQWCCTRQDFIDLQASPAGFGATALDAFASLAKDLKLQPSKMWGAHFTDLVKAELAKPREKASE